jgi:hypothetical protein
MKTMESPIQSKQKRQMKIKPRTSLGIRFTVVSIVVVVVSGGVLLGCQVVNQPDFKGRVDIEFNHKEYQFKFNIERE